MASHVTGFTLPYRTCIKCGRNLPIWYFAAVPWIETGWDIKCTECAGYDREKFKAKTGGDDEEKRLI